MRYKEFQIYPHPGTQADNSLKLHRVNGKDICVIKKDSVFYALGNTCPHAGAPLHTGWCEDGFLICPHHQRKFDLTTGKGSGTQGDFVDTYIIRVKADGVYVCIPEKKGAFELLKEIWQAFFS